MIASGGSPGTFWITVWNYEFSDRSAALLWINRPGESNHLIIMCDAALQHNTLYYLGSWQGYCAGHCDIL